MSESFKDDAFRLTDGAAEHGKETSGPNSSGTFEIQILATRGGSGREGVKFLK